ncbi:MAG: hypothetical protein GY874_12235 [Desulfobacteraceae bacterium]|nr:hypothetical protein [Desulfobacteraceae bacterium]
MNSDPLISSKCNETQTHNNSAGHAIDNNQNNINKLSQIDSSSSNNPRAIGAGDNLNINNVNKLSTLTQNQNVEDKQSSSVKGKDKTAFIKIKNAHKPNSTVLDMMANMKDSYKTFSYQTTGLDPEEFHDVIHIQPEFGDLKKEALYNNIEKLSIKEWNSLIGKSKTFAKSYNNCMRINTQSRSYYEDQADCNFNQEHKLNWEQNEKFDLKGAIINKIYTDNDYFQAAIKKVYRPITGKNIAYYEYCKDDNKIDSVGHDKKRFDSKEEKSKKSFEEAKEDKLNYYKQFYHTRIELSNCLQKYSIKMRGSDAKTLYHGSKFVGSLSKDRFHRFEGPFSTSTSLPVASFFSETRGTIYEFRPFYPNATKSDVCLKAFKAVSLSEYPEEQEWIVAGGMIRLNKIHLGCGSGEYPDDVDRDLTPDETYLRRYYAVGEYFKQDQFSMVKDLAKRAGLLIAASIFTQENSSDQKPVNVLTPLKEVNINWLDLSDTVTLKKIGNYLESGKKNANGLSTEQQQFVNDHKELFDELYLKRLQSHINKIDSPSNFSAAKNFIKTIQINIYNDRLKKRRLMIDGIPNQLESLFKTGNGDKFERTGKPKTFLDLNKINKIYPNLEKVKFFGRQHKINDTIIKNISDYVQSKNGTLKEIRFSYYDCKITKYKPFIGDVTDILNNKEFKSTLEQHNWKIKIRDCGFENSKTNPIEVPGIPTLNLTGRKMGGFDIILRAPATEN